MNVTLNKQEIQTLINGQLREAFHDVKVECQTHVDSEPKLRMHADVLSKLEILDNVATLCGGTVSLSLN